MWFLENFVLPIGLMWFAWVGYRKCCVDVETRVTTQRSGQMPNTTVKRDTYERSPVKALLFKMFLFFMGLGFLGFVTSGFRTW